MDKFLKAVQLSTISSLRERIGGEKFIIWLVTPSAAASGWTPIGLLNSGLWQTVAELADSAGRDPVVRLDLPHDASAN